MERLWYGGFRFPLHLIWSIIFKWLLCSIFSFLCSLWWANLLLLLCGRRGFFFMCCYRIKPFAYKRDIRTCLQFGVLATCHHTSWQLHNPSPFPSTLSLPAHLLPYWILNLPIANKDMLLLSQGTWDRGHARIAAASSWFLPIHAWERENKRNKGEEGRGFVSLLQLDRSMANKGKVCKMDGIFWIWPFMMASYTKIFVFTDLTDIPDHGSFCSKWFYLCWNPVCFGCG